MHFDKVIERLKNNISDLPADRAHQLLAPRHRLSTKEYLRQNPSYKTSCVAVILFPDDEATRLLLMERQDSSTAHGGQISFPGGKREMDDATLLDTAMREMYEEVGVSPSQVHQIGKLSDLYIPVSNFLVHPFAGYCSSRPVFKPSSREVKNIITPDISVFLLNELPAERFESRSAGWIEAPYFPYENYRIWGATAMIISELVYLLKK
jgi:8-oxo-dGTP pyrophosphatase MutT (NUDIX family)